MYIPPRSIELTTPPADEPLTVAQLKSHARIDHAHEDSDYADYIKAARETAEHFTRRQFLEATWTAKYDEFPPCTIWELPYPPLLSVTSLSYLDTAGVSQTLTLNTDYKVQSGDSRFIFLPFGKSWPLAYDEPSAVTIVYKAGWSAPENVPAPIVQAIRMTAAQLILNRETLSPVDLKEIPVGAHRLLEPWKVPHFA